MGFSVLFWHICTVKSDGRGLKNRAVTTIVSDVSGTIFMTRQREPSNAHTLG